MMHTLLLSMSMSGDFEDRLIATLGARYGWRAEWYLAAMEEPNSCSRRAIWQTEGVGKKDKVSLRKGK